MSRVDAGRRPLPATDGYFHNTENQLGFQRRTCTRARPLIAHTRHIRRARVTAAGELLYIHTRAVFTYILGTSGPTRQRRPRSIRVISVPLFAHDVNTRVLLIFTDNARAHLITCRIIMPGLRRQHEETLSKLSSSITVRFIDFIRRKVEKGKI